MRWANPRECANLQRHQYGEPKSKRLNLVEMMFDFASHHLLSASRVGLHGVDSITGLVEVFAVA